VTTVAQGEQGKLADNRGQRPLLRGWLHVVAFVGWLIGGPFLIAAGPDAWAKVALTVYVVGMLAMFGISAAFHRIRWSPQAWRRMRRADHSAIFVGIAGTSTAVAGLALTGWARVFLLTLVWVGAAAGIALRQIWLDAPQWVVAIPYVVVGWCPLAVAPQLVRSRRVCLHGRRAVLRAQVAQSVATRLRLPRGLPRVHLGRRWTLCLPRRVRRAAALLTRPSADSALGAQRGEFVGPEPELARKHLVGVLPEPRHPRLGALGDVG
jgi:channel protein (hemolysin III family)